jgi:hypothetical protein
VRFNSQARSFEGYDRVTNLILKDGMHIIANTVVVSRGMSFFPSMNIKIQTSGRLF